MGNPVYSIPLFCPCKFCTINNASNKGNDYNQSNASFTGFHAVIQGAGRLYGLLYPSNYDILEALADRFFGSKVLKNNFSPFSIYML